ncbi:MAG TPA: RNA pseudouridine synthase, partial [Candidatus Brocadiia bacterium]|nr:RNA pseudouridine synthase [Candidatus Brocadiia bacterium]
WERNEIAIPLGRARRGGRVRAITGAGAGETQDALTVCRVRERLPGATLAEAWPKTGRWRQIRLHFKAIGHPLAGDPEHGDPAANARLQETIGLDRLFLHAAAIAFRHPVTGRPMSFAAPLPPELEGPLNALRGQAAGS